MFGQSIIVKMEVRIWEEGKKAIPAALHNMPQVGDQFQVMLNRGALGVQDGQKQFISFLGHRLPAAKP